MLVAARCLLAAAVVLLATSTAGRERSDSDRGSAARDRMRVDAARSTTYELHVNADNFCNNHIIANSSQGCHRRGWHNSAGANGGRQRAECNRT